MFTMKALTIRILRSHFMRKAKGYDPVDRMQYIDIHTWMRGDILLKADRVTMAHSLELRVPFLIKKYLKLLRKYQQA